MTCSFVRQGFPTVIIENDHVRAEFIPSVGGKMISLKDQDTGYEFLLPSQQPDGGYRQPLYAGTFEDYDTSGFDECFPTVEASAYPSMGEEPGHGAVVFPDHGELWSQPWDVRVSEDEIVLSARGVRWNYEFTKRIRLEGNRLQIGYTLVNRASSAFFVWSAHPLLEVSVGARIILPVSVKSMLLNSSSDDLFGKNGDILSWPHLDSADPSMDYSIIPNRSAGVATKCFTDQLVEGSAALYDPSADESFLFEFDPKHIPYLGIWLCYGGWPPSAEEKHFTVALEPCTGRPDSLEKAILRNECQTIVPGAARSWHLDVSLWKGLPAVVKDSRTFAFAHSVHPK